MVQTCEVLFEEAKIWVAGRRKMRSRLAWQWSHFSVTHALLNALWSLVFMFLSLRLPLLSPVHHWLMSWLCPVRRSRRLCMLRGREREDWPNWIHWISYMVFSLFWRNVLYSYHSARHWIKIKSLKPSPFMQGFSTKQKQDSNIHAAVGDRWFFFFLQCRGLISISISFYSPPGPSYCITTSCPLYFPIPPILVKWTHCK